MTTIFEGNVFSQYGQAYVHLEGTSDYADDVRAGQSNGLLGAAQPSTLFLTFGLHTGNVHLTIRSEPTAPPVDDAWEEIVEASFVMPEDGELGLADWDGNMWEPLPIAAGSYRVRYCARNFGQGESQNSDDEDAQPIEQYELIFWPGDPAPDQVLKTTRPAARYWHNVAQGKA